MSDIKTHACGYTVFSGGNSHFIRAVSVPLTENLEANLANDRLVTQTDDLPKYLAVDSRPTADSTLLIGGIVGVFAFFATWLAAKVLDDVYEAKFQPAIKKALAGADDRLNGANATKSKMLQVGISYADKRVFILIGIIGDTFADILASEHMIRMVHANAVHWVEHNASEEPIHLYIVDRGNVNLEPMLFDNLTLAHRYMRTIERSESRT